MVIFLNRKNAISSYLYPYYDTVKYSVAGMMSGAGGVVAGQPFDILKILVQTNPHKYPSAISALRIILKQDGPKTLFRGMTSPLIGATAVNAVCFGVYGAALRKIKKWREHDKENITDIAMAGVFSGTINTIFQVPSDLIKTKLQSGIYRSNLECIREISKTSGKWGFFNGFRITWIRDAPGFAVYFTTYELLHEQWGDSTFALLNAGGWAGVLSWISTYPMDVIKSRLQSLPVYPHEGWDMYTSSWDCAKKSYRADGVRVFYKGLMVCCARAYPVNAVVFYLYESTLQYLNKIKPQ